MLKYIRFICIPTYYNTMLLIIRDHVLKLSVLKRELSVIDVSMINFSYQYLTNIDLIYLKIFRFRFTISEIAKISMRYANFRMCTYLSYLEELIRKPLDVSTFSLYDKR